MVSLCKLKVFLSLGVIEVKNRLGRLRGCTKCNTKCNIQLKKAVEGATFLTFGFTSLRIKYWVPTMDLVKVPSEMLTFDSKD